ncbi:MAG: hypothetical protein DMG41_28570 [Acidobacteria bacterium]|nr:MAG: hypothetical protein AUH13_11830 [Acidobacteria bacterium 13_2_20CM_58_27]PYT69798.1 MAG: hypothetical protein DMG42_20780 [Acidobacteriota bacterium]PYT84100.1 MAG: hypothetical protein DMG41_28570 [Acidobacteriota bacterium]
MKTSIIICIFVLLCSVTGSTASSTPLIKAGELLKVCKYSVAYANTPDRDQGKFMGEYGYEIALCSGFISGWIEAMNGGVVKGGEDHFYILKFDSEATVGQVIRVFVNYMSKHPEGEHRSGDWGLHMAVEEANLVTLTPIKASTKNASAH